MTDFTGVQPDDLLVIDNHDEWIVTGIYLGAIGQESVVSIRSRRKTCPSVDRKTVLDDLLVPYEMIAQSIRKGVITHYRPIHKAQASKETE